jgi:hypothetical protein
MIDQLKLNPLLYCRYCIFSRMCFQTGNITTVSYRGCIASDDGTITEREAVELTVGRENEYFIRQI